MGKFLVSVSSKGGVGKSTLAFQILIAILFKKYGKVHKLIEIDDNNKTDGFKSGIFEPKSFKVDKGINEALKGLFDVFGDENIVLDIGGGNDSIKAIDALTSIGVDENVVYFIPILKNKHGIKNLMDTYSRIRKKSNSQIVIILNQATSACEQVTKSEFAYFFGNKELNIAGVFKDLYSDNNLIVAQIGDTNVYDLAEDYNLTSYEIANEKINTAEFLKEAKEESKDVEEFMKALAFINVYTLCKENHEDSFLKFYEDVKDVI